MASVKKENEQAALSGLGFVYNLFTLFYQCATLFYKKKFDFCSIMACSHGLCCAVLIIFVAELKRVFMCML